MRIFLIVFFALLGYTSHSQHLVDSEKVKTIGNILCKCFENNAEDEVNRRVSDCGSVLAEGLSVIRSESLKITYSTRVNTFLQKNCKEYIEIVLNDRPDSDISIEELDKFHTLNKSNNNSRLNNLRGNKYYYQDFIGDTIIVDVTEDFWIEKSKKFNSILKLSIEKSSQKTFLKFLNSNEEFFDDYYSKDELIELFVTKEEYGYLVFMKYLNGIVLSKKIRPINS